MRSSILGLHHGNDQTLNLACEMTFKDWAEVLFWVAGFLLFFAYAGYPVLLAIWVKLWKRAEKRLAHSADSQDLSAAVVLVVRNEEARIKERLANLAATNSSCVRELIVVCDGCTDGTAVVTASFPDTRVRVLKVEPGRGKPAGVNAGIAAATSDVIVLCDARQRFLPDTLPKLLAWFSDPATGAVSGALEIEPSASGPGQGVDAYWKLEKLIRRMESELDSSIGCTGAVYAIRRDAFEPIPEDTLLDDVVIPMRIAERGLRVRFCPEAVAYDPQTLQGPSEERRKLRTLGGNFQMLCRYPRWLLPWRHRLWWKLIAHKYLRLLGPVLLLVVLLAAGVLRGQWLYGVALIAQCAFYTGALFAWVFPRWKFKILGMAAGFLFLQICIVRGFVWWLRTGRRVAGWK